MLSFFEIFWQGCHEEINNVRNNILLILLPASSILVLLQCGICHIFWYAGDKFGKQEQSKLGGLRGQLRRVNKK